MKKALLIASVLFIAVISTACINNIAVQELNNKAAEYMKKGDYDAAVNRLQASIDLDSTMYETYYNLGIAATNAKKYEVAIEALESGLKIKPDFADFYYSLATAQYEYAESKIEVEDKKAENITNQIDILKLKHAALANLKEYLLLNPNSADREDIEEIIEELNKYIEEHKDYPTQVKSEG